MIKETIILMMTKTTQMFTYHFIHFYQNIAERGVQHHLCQSGNYYTKVALLKLYQKRVCAVVTDQVHMVSEWSAFNHFKN